MAKQDWTDAQIQQLVRDLELLRGGALASAALIGCGPRSIEPLRRFLLLGTPRGIFEPRQLAVETLAELGARDVLLEYLKQSRNIVDPVVRFSEANVQSTAARALSRWQSEEVYLTLKNFAETRLLPGLVEALGEFARVETVPYFLWALGDDECRDAAEQALRKVVKEARPLFVEAATKPSPSVEEEIPSSRIRRRKVLAILAEGNVTANEWHRLCVLVDDPDIEISIIAARIALEVGSEPERARAIRKLIEAIPRADWFLRTYVRTSLASHFRLAKEQIEAEIAKRSAVSAKERALDIVLRLLVNLKAQVEKSEQIGADLCANRT